MDNAIQAARGTADAFPDLVTGKPGRETPGALFRTLEWCDWSHSRAAEILGIGRTTLWRKLKEYHIEARFHS